MYFVDRIAIRCNINGWRVCNRGGAEVRRAWCPLLENANVKDGVNAAGSKLW
jgi:hypothetical protein